MIRVIDSHALLAFLEKEKGFEKVEKCFVEALAKDAPLLMSCVNFGEVYYIVLRECGAGKVREILNVIETLPISIVDVDKHLALEAARFKALHKISYADCFAAALAAIHNGEVVTGDSEFKAFEGKIRILWIR